MILTVYVNDIHTTREGTVITAANGSKQGPPFLQFSVMLKDAGNYSIGKRISIQILED